MGGEFQAVAQLDRENRMNKFILITFCTLTAIATCARLANAQTDAPTPDAPATMEQLQQIEQQKDWTTLLQKLARVSALHGPATQPYDQYELAMMKGEAHLQLKQTQAAALGFTEAVKQSNGDKKKAAVASATATLVKRSPAPAFSYARKSPTTQPSEAKTFNILDPSKRSDAFAAVAADEVATLKPRAKSAAAASSLRPTIELLKSLDDLRDAELAASGSTPLLDDLVGPLATRANELSQHAIDAEKTKVETVERNSNTISETAIRGADRKHTGNYNQRKRGLIGNDTQILRLAITNCQSIASGDRELADVFGDAGKALTESASSADAVASHAKAVIDANNSTVTNGR